MMMSLFKAQIVQDSLRREEDHRRREEERKERKEERQENPARTDAETQSHDRMMQIIMLDVCRGNGKGTYN